MKRFLGDVLRRFRQRFFVVAVLIPGVNLTPMTMAIALETEPKGMPIRGLVRALEQAKISTDLAARVSKIHVRQGESFQKGDILIEFDCARLEARRDAGAAALASARIAHSGQNRLFKRGATGRQDLLLAFHEQQRKAAELTALNARLTHCLVRAPFDGRVVELHLHAFETPVAGEPVIRLVGRDAFEINIIVPSTWLARIAVGTKLDIKLDETTVQHAATVRRIGAAVDPVSQTVQIIAAFDAPNARVLPGMSGDVTFNWKAKDDGGEVARRD